jgi:hypothetical protein
MSQHNYKQEPNDAPPPETEAICAQTVFEGQLIEPDMWFDQTQKGQSIAVELCYKCPLILRCAAQAVENNEEFGVWGGLTPENRKRMKKNQTRRKPMH